VTIEALIVTEPPVPGNVSAEIVTSNLIGGGATLSLDTTGPPSFNPPIQARSMIPTHYVGLRLNIVPSQFGETADKIAVAADEIAKISHDLRATGIAGHLNDAVTHADAVMNDVHVVLGDEKTQTDLRTTIANFRQASEKANAVAGDLKKLSDQASATMTDARTSINRTQDHIDTLAASAGNRLQQLSKLLDSAASIAVKIDRGQGAAGQLVNDPKLYQALVDASRELELMIQDLRRLAEQWEQEGVTLKLH
jgi:phospholipid/cholesterol/gamma-HCH transport system substrate-binding protein